MLFVAVNAGAAEWFYCAGDTFCGKSTSDYWGTVDLASGQSSPTGSTNVWRWTFPSGMPGGEGVGNVWTGDSVPGGQQEMWVQYWWKYSSNFTLHPIMNKQMYFYPSNTIGMSIVTGDGVVISPQGPNGVRYTPNLGAGTGYIAPGSWHKFKGRYRLNTGSSFNGIWQAWVDDVQVANYSNVYYQDGSSELSAANMIVIYGGTGGSVPQTQYMYVAGMYLGSTDPGGSTTVDQTPPYVYGASPAEGSTGNLKTNRSIVAHVADGVAVTRSSVTMGVSVNGGAVTTYSYGSGLTFSPNTATSSDFTVTRTQGSDYSDSDTVAITINASDNAATPNVMPTKSYSFSIAPAASTSFKTRGQVLTYLQGLSALSSKKTLSGQFTQFVPWPLVGIDDFNDTASVSGGKYPALMGADAGVLESWADATDWSNWTGMLIDHWNAGGLVTVSWHALNPVDNAWTWAAPGGSAVTLSELYTAGNDRYTNFHAELDIVAAALQTLEDDNVVVLFRPFHEMNGNWFWWGDGDAAQYKLLWQHVYNYLTTTKGLSNLIWVYAVNVNWGETSTYYPGTSYVDVTGIDYYSATARFPEAAEYDALVALGKPFLLTEVGQCAAGLDSGCAATDAKYTIDDIKSYMPATIGFMYWGDPYSLASRSNVTGLFNDTWVINRSDNPSGGISAGSVTIVTTTLSNGTVGSAYNPTNQALSVIATNGTSPYTWSVVSGTLPAGLSLSTSGVISGTPTAAGTSSFTVRVTDSSASPLTDDQALSIVIGPILPGGQYTVTGLAYTDSYINSGSAGTNYGTATTMTAYQWPAATVSNRIILKNASDITALPDNIAITSATVRLYMTSYEGSGGTNPMRIHARSISGTLPDPATVTWTSFAGTLSSDLSVTDVSLVSSWLEWDVTSYVQAQYAASKAAVYVALEGSSDGASDTNRIFASVNNATTANRPQLVIVYTQLVDPAGPSISAPGKMRITRFRGVMK